MAGKDTIINTITIAISIHIIICPRFVFFLRNGILRTLLIIYIVSKLVMATPAPAIIISGGATIANNGGITPVAPRALNK